MVKLLVKAHHLLVVVMVIFRVHIVIFTKHLHKVLFVSRPMSVVYVILEKVVEVVARAGTNAPLGGLEKSLR